MAEARRGESRAGQGGNKVEGGKKGEEPLKPSTAGLAVGIGISTGARKMTASLAPWHKEKGDKKGPHVIGDGKEPAKSRGKKGWLKKKGVLPMCGFTQRTLGREGNARRVKKPLIVDVNCTISEARGTLRGESNPFTLRKTRVGGRQRPHGPLTVFEITPIRSTGWVRHEKKIF